MTDSFRNLWAAQAGGSTFTSPEEIAMKSDKFTRTVRRRNIREYIAGALVVTIFTAMAIFFITTGETLLAAASALNAVGGLVVMYGLYTRAGTVEPQPEQSCSVHLRAQLVRQRDALATVPRWYLAPLAPGVALLSIGFIELSSRTSGFRAALVDALPGIGLAIAIFAGVWWLNSRAASQLDREIADLDALA